MEPAVYRCSRAFGLEQARLIRKSPDEEVRLQAIIFGYQFRSLKDAQYYLLQVRKMFYRK